MLSLSNNRLEDIHNVTSLRALRSLRVDRNRITRLPGSLSSLRDLAVLDVSHNRLEAVPPALADLAARLYRCAVVLFLLHGFPGLSTDTSDHISVFYFSVFFLFSFFLILVDLDVIHKTGST